MSRDAFKTLFHPFATDAVPMPQAGERVLFLGAEAGQPPQGFDGEITAIQPFRPLFRAIRENAFPEAEDSDYDAALILCGKHRGDNENRIVEALERVKVGGLIVIAGGKEDGIQPLRNALLKLNVQLDYTPKYHGVAVWFARPEDAESSVAALKKPYAAIEGIVEAGPGMV